MKKVFLIAFIFMISILSYLSAIQVSGNQSGVWSVDNNPYEVIGDVIVPVGSTLTIQPGVIIRAMGNYQITAQGNIMANGTAADSIYFGSGQTDPNALWKGIRLENTSVQSQFSYCRIDLGDYGINTINSPVSITYCHFKLNKRGIQSYGIGSANPAQVLIDHNLIELTVQNGILVAQNSNTTITNNEITRNGTSASYYGAIQLSNQSAGGSNSPLIAYNHIHHNYKQGIIAWDIVSANAIQPVVHHNLVENNLSGIYFRHASGYLHHNTVRNNFIPGDMNSGAGFMISGATAQPYLEDNIVTGNYTGFYLTENANPILGDLSIYHAWAQGGNQIFNNIDANNVMHSIYCYNYTNSSIVVKAENNFWDYNTAAQIAATIEDNNDNPSLPTIDFEPWQNNPIPILLAGTVILTNPPVPTATLELVSAVTGDVINYWTVNINEPFSVPVYHDSLVYIVAHMINLVGQQYYGAFGGTDNPAATQIVADVQFDIGNLSLSYPRPNWYYRKIGAPQSINGQLSYPMQTGWFVYAPNQTFFLYNEGDFHKLSRIEAWLDSTFYSFNVDNPPIYMKVNNLDTSESWEQYTGAMLYPPHTIYTRTAHSVADITTFKHGVSSSYDFVGIPNRDFQLYDYHDNLWVMCHMYLNHYGLTGKWRITPVVVEPDGTLFPLVQNNYWKSLPDTYMYDVPDYFGYKIADSLRFYWIPPYESQVNRTYRIYNNGNFLIEVPVTMQRATVPIPSDGLEHTYTLSIYYNNTDHFCDSSITLTVTTNQDEVQSIAQFSVYPNPFSPVSGQLTFKLDNLTTGSKFKSAVYNLKGQLVWSAVSESGAKQLNWDGRDKFGKTCAAGLYQIVVTDNKGSRHIRKILILK